MDPPTINLTNQTDQMDHLQISVSYMCKTVVFLTIILVAIFSNLLVIASVFLYRKLRGINNYFLVSLAFADLFVACFAMTFNASQQIFGRWIFGSVICDMYNSIDVHASTVSTLHLCCISLDRYFAIVKPFDYHYYMNTRSALAMICAAWMFPTLISFVPILLGWSGESAIRENTGLCVFNANLPYALLSSFMTFWCPVIVMVTVYYRVFRSAVKQKTSMAMATVNLPTVNGYASEVHGRGSSEGQAAVGGEVQIAAIGGGGNELRDEGTKSKSSLLEGLKERKRLNTLWRKSALKEHKAFVTLGVVMGAFLLCWLPFFLWYLTVTMCGKACPCPDSVVVTLFWIGYFNSTLNPVIYAMTNRDFKLAFIGILKKLFCCSNSGRRDSDF